MGKIKLDLHDIYNKGELIEKSLQRVLNNAIENRITEIEIIPGKGSGQLKKSVIRFFLRPEIKTLYHRLKKDSKNFGRIFIYLK